MGFSGETSANVPQRPQQNPRGGERPACGRAQSGLKTHFALNICYIGYIILYYNIYYRIYLEIHIKYVL